jgi:hypothetical protein
MPSSSSPPSLLPKALNPLEQPLVSVNVDRYREVVYHDGRGRFTTDSRRRSRTASWVESTALSHPSCSPKWPEQSDMSLGIQRSVLKTNQTTNMGQTAVPVGGRHVTVAKHAPQSRPKIIVERQRRRDGPENVAETFQIFKGSQEPRRQYWTEVSTPPSTPRIRRLSTPELSGAEDTPFCDCNNQREVVRCCTSCRRQVDHCLASK